MEQHVLVWIAQYGPIAVFCLLVTGIVGLPVPDETLLTFSGYLIFKGRLNPAYTFAAALGGSGCGITLSYTLGWTFGLALIHRYGKILRIREEHVERAHRFFERAGHWSLTFGYFVPGVRHLTAYAAGMSDLEAPQFALFAYSGALMWVSTFLGLGYFLGERWQAVEQIVHHYLAGCAIALAALGAAYWIWRKLKRARTGARN